MSTNIRRITATINTVPAYLALTGTVTSNTTDTTVLNYAGTDDWYTIFNRPGPPPLALTPNPYTVTPDSVSDAQSKIYLYVPGNALVQVLGATVTGTNTWALQLAEGLSGLTAAACNYVVANLLGYLLINDGGGTGIINGVNIVAGESLSEPQLSPKGARIDFWPPLLVDATSTDFLVTENS